MEVMFLVLSDCLTEEPNDFKNVDPLLRVGLPAKLHYVNKTAFFSRSRFQ